jgi:hypothetical protein
MLNKLQDIGALSRIFCYESLEVYENATISQKVKYRTT